MIIVYYFPVFSEPNCQLNFILPLSLHSYGKYEVKININRFNTLTLSQQVSVSWFINPVTTGVGNV